MKKTTSKKARKISKTFRKYYGIYSNRGIAVIQVLGDHKMPMIFQSKPFAQSVADTRTKQYKRKHYISEVIIMCEL